MYTICQRNSSEIIQKNFINFVITKNILCKILIQFYALFELKILSKIECTTECTTCTLFFQRDRKLFVQIM